jgi:hypothetical protein
VVVGVAVTLLEVELLALEVQVAVAQGVLATTPQLLELLTPVVAVVVAVFRTAVSVAMEVLVALALLSLKCLTTYPQHSLVALHLACPHPVGSTSTL